MLKESAWRQERWIQAKTNRNIQSNLDTVRCELKISKNYIFILNLYSWSVWFDEIEFIILLTFDTVELETNSRISFLYSYYMDFDSLHVEYI